MRPNIRHVTVHDGIAGQRIVTAVVQYHPDEQPIDVTFVGSIYGGPVVVVGGDGAQTFVKEPSAFGTLSAEWVRQFFAEEGKD